MNLGGEFLGGFGVVACVGDFSVPARDRRSYPTSIRICIEVLGFECKMSFQLGQGRIVVQVSFMIIIRIHSATSAYTAHISRISQKESRSGTDL